ncbi:OmpA family protein [Cyclobacterium xiamenense]|uniref:OmpA family protein n=1 Tax=Cyclobacterium xiamenense TaxID=1297121 RepID=A0A1H6T2Z8_9BACT|nr:OmpA family protein [Cyclobacterium xiamenense]SEI74483.1 OmpA family protein [Cyclobacterium xiamenense]
MKTKNCILLLVVFFLYLMPGLSQQYRWRMGLSTGYTNYYGQLRPYSSEISATLREAFRPSFPLRPESNWNASLEKRLTSGLGLSFYGGRQTLSGNGTDLSEISLKDQAPTLYEAKLWSMGSALIFRMDNGKLLRQTSFLAPYVLLGIGWRHWEGQTHRLLFDSPQADFAENESGPLFRQEQSGSHYYLDMGLGLRLRLSRQVELFIQSNAQPNNTPLFEKPRRLPAGAELRDQANRSDPATDWLFQHQLGIKLSLAPRGAVFNASSVSPSGRLVRIRSEPEISSTETIAGRPEGMPLPASSEERSAISPDPKPEHALESPVAPNLSKGTLESNTTAPTENKLASRYFLGSGETLPLESDYVQERNAPYPSFHSVYPVYPEPPSERSGGTFRQLPQARSFPPRQYADNRPARSYYRLFVPVLPPLVGRQMGSSPDTSARDNLPKLSSGISKVPAAMPASPGLRLQPQVPLWSGSIPEWWGDLPGIWIGTTTTTIPPEEITLPPLYAAIYFEINQHAVSAPALAKLAAIAGTLRRFPDTRVALTGYADHTGSTAYNLTLAEKRSRSVAQALEERFGIARDRIQLFPGAQLVRGAVSAAQPEDRKVEVQILFLNSGIE